MKLTEEQMVDEVLKWFDEAPVAAQIVFKNSSLKDLHDYHHSLGQDIRNTFKLWESRWSPQLIDGVDYSPWHPDAISMRIIQTAWEKINSSYQAANLVTNVRDSSAPTPLENKWQVGTDKNSTKVFLDSTGFDEFDVRMYIDGNFGGKEATQMYAAKLAAALNSHGIFP